jgi:hypothetical protein
MRLIGCRTKRGGTGHLQIVADLARKLRKYIRVAKSAKPFRESHADPKRRIRAYETPGQLNQLLGVKSNSQAAVTDRVIMATPASLPS